MPLRFEFFDDPLLRLTPPSALNDPFDSKPTKIGIEKKTNFFFDDGETLGKPKVYGPDLRQSYENRLRTGLDDFGVISLTEDPYNLLMWSHYGNEHKGVVVSILCDSSTFVFHSQYTENCGVSKKIPERVIYSNRRPGHEMPDNAIYEYFENNFYTHFAMTKGNDWIYEKEYRYLMRTDEADVGIVESQNQEWIEKKHDGIVVTHIRNNSYKVEASLKSSKQYLKLMLLVYQGRGEISDVKLFKRISKKSLTGIYFGCRVSDDDILRVREKIKNQDFFSQSIALHRSVESQDRFEINFERLY